MLALVAASLGSGAFGRYLLSYHADGLLFWAVFTVAVALLALPLLLGEAALGQFRRRNVVHAFGPGPWGWAGGLFALACIPLAAYLAVVAGWSARLAYDSFGGGFFDDPDRHFRLALQGWDAMLLALGALVVAAGVALGGVKRGLRGPLSAVAIVGLVAAGGLALYALAKTGAHGREVAFAFHPGALDGRLAVEAVQQSLVPAFLGLGLVATLSAGVHDRTLPREAVLVGLLWVLVPLALGSAFAALADHEGVALDGFGFESIGQVAARMGGTAGGMVAGTAYGLLLAGSLAALVAILEVPATWLHQRFEGLGERRGLVGAALLAYLLAVPMAFDLAFLYDAELVLAVLVAPLGGLLVALHVGWARPQVLDGFLVGDAGHHLDRFLRPVLRYVLPLPLAFLVVLGALEVLADRGTIARHSSWLWDLVP